MAKASAATEGKRVPERSLFGVRQIDRSTDFLSGFTVAVRAESWPGLQGVGQPVGGQVAPMEAGTVRGEEDGLLPPMSERIEAGAATGAGPVVEPGVDLPPEAGAFGVLLDLIAAATGAVSRLRPAGAIGDADGHPVPDRAEQGRPAPLEVEGRALPRGGAMDDSGAAELAP